MDQLKKLFLSLTLKQRISLGVAVLAVVGGLMLASHWNKERDFKPIYSGMSQEDAAAVLAKVREAGSEFRLSENGSAVLVPSNKVAELRLSLAAAGVPKSGRIGFELFDKTNFGTSDFAEQINYHRALEGELERSIMSLSEVEQARVHLTFAKDSVFLESKQPAKASVLLKLKPGARMSAQNVAAICQLTASAVEGLAPEAISVVDMRGNLLSRPRKSLLLDGQEPDEATLDYRSKIERELLAKINTTLEPLLGAEKFRATVSVDCDFSSGEQSEETFDPGKSVIVTSQKTEDISGGGSASGVPGTPSNLPRPTSKAGTGSTGVARRTENTAYQSSRIVRKVRLPQGAIKRMSVSVLLDQHMRFDGVGPRAKRVIEPPAPERIKAIKEVVSAVVGLSTERGDQIIVETLAFETTLNMEPPALPATPTPTTSLPNGLPPWLQEALRNKIMLAAGAGIALLFVAGIAMVLIRRRKKLAGIKIQQQLAAADAKGELKPATTTTEDIKNRMEAQLAEQTADRDLKELEALHALKLPQITTKKAEVLTKHINLEAKKDPKVMAQILRSWINEANK